MNSSTKGGMLQALEAMRAEAERGISVSVVRPDAKGTISCKDIGNIGRVLGIDVLLIS